MLKAQGVKKTFFPGSVNEKRALRGVDLTLEDGDFATVIGSNGAGKSTFLNAIAGVFPIDSGTIEVGGVDISDMPEYKRAQYIGRVFQDPMRGTAGNMMIEENLAMASRRGQKLGLSWSSKPEQTEKFREMLKELDLGLEERMTAHVGLLSGGQRQRVAIARALSLHPDAIIADEPPSALDVSVRAQIPNLLTDLKKELGLAMVFISHDIQTVRYISDDIIVMNGGKIVEQGEAKQVFQHPQDPYTKMLLGAAPSLLHPKLGE